MLCIFIFFSVLATITQIRRLRENSRKQTIITRVVESSSYHASPIGSVLLKYGQDLTAHAKSSQLGAIVGRHEEVNKVLQIFSRRSKNNPVLVGHPGVGKTAIIDALAQRIVEGDIPENFKKFRVASIDANTLIAGTKVLGDFEQRMRGVVDDIESHVILFIDELHVLLQMGKNESTGGNVLKPYLSMGRLHCVGAMTLFNYNKFIESDPTLSRHFQQVTIEEPTVEQSIDILRTVRPRLEAHHNVKISDESLVTASTYSYRYMTELHLPDKAIDLIDTAAARISLKLETKPDAIKDLSKTITILKAETEILKKDPKNIPQIEKNEAELKSKQSKLEGLMTSWTDSRKIKESNSQSMKKIEDARAELVLAESANDFIRVVELKSRIENLQTLITTHNEDTSTTVTSHDVAVSVSMLTGIPMTNLMAAERDRVLNLEKVLMSRIIGQDEAVQSISNAIRISRAGLHTYGRPLGSFLFLGPTGVGKTQLCRVLAQELFNDANAMVRIDMSEYMEKFSVSRLIGAPPGYVGYEEGGTLTEAVRRRPSSLVLFDEFEKAHREVSNLLLQLLDAGHLTDSRGRKIDFCNTMVIMTSNLGSEVLSKLPDKYDIAQARESVMEIVKSNFPPEFLNRIDEVIVFNRLNRKNLDLIVDIEIKNMVKMLSDRKITLTLSPQARTWIADKGFDRLYGARPLKRVLQRWLLNPLASLMLSGNVAEGSEVVVNVVHDQLAVEKV